jgi:hypothetical protein
MRRTITKRNGTIWELRCAAAANATSSNTTGQFSSIRRKEGLGALQHLWEGRTRLLVGTRRMIETVRWAEPTSSRQQFASQMKTGNRL